MMCNLLLAGTLLLTADVTVQPVVGDAVSGPLKELSVERIVITGAEGDREFAAQDVLTVTPGKKNASAASEARVQVHLLDKSRVLLKDIAVSKRQATLSLLGGGTLETHTRSFQSVRLKKPAEGVNAAWSEIVAGEVEADVIVFRRGPDTLDELEGVIHDVTAEEVEFEIDDEKVPVGRDRLEGFVYFHANRRELPSTACAVDDVHGSRWQAKSLAVENDEVTLTTVAGVRVVLPLAEIQQFDFSAGNLVYLSDLDPESHRWSPQFGTKILPLLEKWNAYKRDHGFFTDTLPLGDRKGGYTKGLAMFSKTELVYRLTEDYERLQALVGIDNRYRPNGNVEFVIWGNDKELFRQTITGEMEPIQLNLDISNVRRLRILCDIGAEQQSCDYLIMAEARITK
ncbi:MAG TPA: hypothetical protein DCY79_23320 [Planctomycetaceae bacterium]|nr:hypothetical protein [Planctomycetaceae bacterium]